MNALRYLFIRALPISALFCASLYTQQAVPAPDMISTLWDTPLGLPRLAHQAKRLGSVPIDRDAFEVLAMSSGPRAKLGMRGGAQYLELEAGSDWSTNLRQGRNRPIYVSFTLNASFGTIVNIGGAAFSIGQSDQDLAYATITPVGSNVRINQEIPWLLFSGSRMAPLNIVTIKIDHESGTWAIWFRDMLMAENIPISTGSGRGNQIRIQCGKGGVWLCGLVSSDENPLFEDANDNTVPDSFEEEVLGFLLDSKAPDQTRAALRTAWIEEKLTRPSIPFVLNAPLPDSFPENCGPDGSFVHGMNGGMKFGVGSIK